MLTLWGYDQAVALDGKVEENFNSNILMFLPLIKKFPASGIYSFRPPSCLFCPRAENLRARAEHFFTQIYPLIIFLPTLPLQIWNLHLMKKILDATMMTILVNLFRTILNLEKLFKHIALKGLAGEREERERDRKREGK